MKILARIPVAILVLLAFGCSRIDRQGDLETSAAVDGNAGTLTRNGSARAAVRDPRSSFANLPDHGDLMAYPGKVVRRDGAYTLYRADLSEEHALHAIADGHLRVTTPEGEILEFHYDRHVEHPSGDWTWIGHRPGHEGEQVILTFGAEAAFGSIAQPGKPSLRLTVRDGAGWLVETHPAKLDGIANATTRTRRPDYHIVPESELPRRAAGIVAAEDVAATSPGTSATTSMAATAVAATRVDLIIGYTPGFANANGGTSGATTRLNYLVDVANVAYGNSKVDAQVRLIKAIQVTYTDTNSNDTALEQLSGYKSGSGPVTPNAAFDALRAAREQYGADLVSLVRDFRDPEQDGCGLAWLLGGGLQGIGPGEGWDELAYSVIGDGVDQGSDGKSYYCMDSTLAHEMGHNMGAAHDRETAKGDDGVLDNPDDYGAYTYSFGYKTGAAAGNFYTVMAYGDSGQTGYLVFSNPAITFCGGRYCGVDNQADNARNLRQTIPVVARFRGGASPPDLFAVNRQGGSGTEVSIVGGNTNYTLFDSQFGTALGKTGTKANWVFRAGDYNGDGITDMFVVKKQGTTRTEVHVLDGKTQFGTWLLHSGTPLQRTGDDEGWVFDLGDYNRDGHLDVYVIRRMGGTGRTEVHVLDGSNQFKTYLLHSATTLHQTGSTPGWKFAVGDFNRDGHPDIYVIKRNTASGFAEIHVLDGATAFKTYLLHQGMPFRAPGTSNDWEFKVGDYNRDDILDLYAIKKQGSGKTELHIVDGADSYTTFLAHLATPIGVTGTDWTWDFSLATQ